MLEHGEIEIRRVAAELASSAVNAEEIQRIVAARTGRILMRRLPSQNQAMYDSLQIFYRMPTGGNLEFLAAMNAVTPDQVSAAARRYIRPEQWSLAMVR